MCQVISGTYTMQYVQVYFKNIELGITISVICNDQNKWSFVHLVKNNKVQKNGLLMVNFFLHKLFLMNKN